MIFVISAADLPGNSRLTLRVRCGTILTMDDIGNSCSDFILDCAALAAVSERDCPFERETPVERRRWRFQMGVWILAILVLYVVLDWGLRWFFDV